MSESEENPTKKQKTESENVPPVVSKLNESEKPICVICMEPDCEENPLQENHSCPTCKPNAWRICEECDERCLSRDCPVCRGPYAPMELHVFPSVKNMVLELRTNGLPSGVPAKESDYIKLVNATLSLLFKLMKGSRIGLWSPSDVPGEGLMEMAIPIDTNAEEEDWKCARYRFPCGEERLSDDLFKFESSVYDEMEAAMESGDQPRSQPQPEVSTGNTETASAAAQAQEVNPNVEESTLTEAFKWITTAAKVNPKRKIFTRFKTKTAMELILAIIEDSG